ncbi:PilN domain-containing protein [Legionella impletisoli]|uniref:Pilus assembly protein PilN n=1 Tax=Legionella impletisoli TaxID=343510 RepID=A0A917NDD1_9GAMM|nr:PilN domain-containing protein [Legionella impletisoli]GGI91154.1 pilus assembly protein PilN [Legionella impletisoli]
MTEINLLPWREARREKEKKEFTLYLGVALAAAAIVVFMWNMYAKNLIEDQTNRNQILQTEITRLKAQIKEIEELKKLREALIARMNIVQNLQATRTLTVRMFDELVNVLPNGVYLTQIEREGDKITLFGYAESNSNISELMRNIEANQWIQSPELTEIKKAKDSPENVDNTFKLSFILGPKTNGVMNEKPESK